MYIDDWTIGLAKYFGIKVEVSSEIKRFLRSVKDKDLDDLWEYMRLNISPSKRIGVSDVNSACKFLAIQVRHNTGYQFKRHTVECEVCGSRFDWKLYASDYDKENGIYERCPKCRFPYEDSWVVAQYENTGLTKNYGNEHRAYVKKYRERLAQTKVETDIDKMLVDLKKKLHFV